MKKKTFAVRATLVASLAILASLATIPLAPAQVTVGQTAPSPSSLFHCNFTNPFDELQTSVAAGTSYVVPGPGVLTSWSTSTGPAPGQVLGLKVFRPLGGISYQVVAQDGPRALASSTLNTFPVVLPVQAGDIVGILVPPGAKTDCLFETSLSGDVIGFNEGNVPVGGAFQLDETYSEFRVNLSATLLPPPVVASIGPAAGSIAGGASVVIAGANFAAVQGVSFGSVPATSFSVNSEGQITAVAPSSTTLSAVPVTVTTAAGAALSAQLFTYQGCLVPQLRGKKLKAAKKKARKASCKIGKVKMLGDATAKTGKVVKQRPKAGKVLVPGSKINIKLKS